jgi:predicted nuclease of predicted toxin-antitoxin system
MKLLFDQNLSPRLVSLLSDLFPDSTHVQLAELGTASDRIVWDFAKAGTYAIVSKDSDFSDRATVEGPPPKVIAVTLGNCSTRQVESLLRMKAQAILTFGNDNEEGVLILP